MKKNNRTFIFCCYAGAFFIPFILMIIILSITGIWPFGTKTILTSDLENQYVQFFSYLREIYKGNHSIFYTFSKTFGGEMLSLYAYYLMSPLNIILLFFRNEWLPQAIELLILIKISLCSLTFYFLISHLSAHVRSSGLIFSISYALMAYNMAYFFHLMWLDSIILLPLIILGLHRILEGHFPALYTLSLGFAILFNYYIGFMLCIFSVFYFCTLCAVQKKRLIRDFSIFFNYGLASLVAGLLSVFILLPTLKGLSGGKATFDTSLFTFSGNFSWRDFFIKFLNGCFYFKNNTVSGLPNIFCGIMILFLCILFFMNSRIGLCKKLGAGFLLVTLCLSFYFQIFNLVWHGFNPPSSFPYRYSFLFSFLLILTAWYSLEHLNAGTVRIWYPAAIAGVLIVSILVLMQKVSPGMTTGRYLLNAGIVFVSAIFLTAYIYCRKQIFIVLMSLLCMLDLTGNGIQYLSCYTYKDNSDFQTFVNDTSEVLSWIRTNDTDFYRIEKDFRQRANDPMLLDYAGLSHFSSSETTQVLDFLEALGFPRTFAYSGYYNTTFDTMNCFFGIRYLLSCHMLSEPYHLVRQIGDIYIYENPYALTLGMTADSSAEAFHPTVQKPRQPFETQNQLFSCMQNDSSENIFDTQTLTPVLHNLRVKEGARYPYRVIVPEQEAFFDYTFTAASNEPVFCYIDAPAYCRLKMYVNDKEINVFNPSYQITSIGSFDKGETVHVRIVPQTSKSALNSFCIAYQNSSAFEKFFSSMQDNSMQITSFSDDHITGFVKNTQAKPLALFTIPYDTDWEIYVNGQPSTAVKLADALLGVKLPADAEICKIELRYVPHTFYIGLAVSGSALLFFLFWYMIFRKKQIQN